MKRMLTGIQPTGAITLGNYIGSIKQMVDNQGKYESYFFVADMHAITVDDPNRNLYENTRSLVAIYLACGIDPKLHTLFVQSQNEYHANVSYFLECNTYYGELSRMHQFKEKSRKNENFTTGLLTYPVLMAADILIYDADIVPVGIDQKQHVELARDIAIRFNKKYGDTFVVPNPEIKTDGTKITDLLDPTKKMSKSSENQNGVIRLLDEPEVIRKKIMRATTDSEMLVKFDPDNKPGISNLLNIASSVTGRTIEDISKEYDGKGYGEFKKYVASVTSKFVSDIQDKYNKLINSKELEKVLDDGIKKSRKLAEAKYDLMKKRMGVTREVLKR